MQYIKLITLLVLSANLQASNLPELQTKQALDNIRYLTHDGKFTYYQQNSGELQLSTNYATENVLKMSRGTGYSMSGTSTRKKLIIEVRKNVHKDLNFRSENEIYTLNFGKSKATKIGNGIFGKLNLNDTWITFFSPKTSQIVARNISQSSKTYKIKLKNKLNPYFIPQYKMATADTILYTDLNDQGHMALNMYSVIDKKFTTIYKSNFPGMRIDFCIQNEKIYLGEFTYASLNRGSTIYQIDLYGNPNFNKIKTIYSSELDDIGKLTCTKQDLYFIKTIDFNEKINTKKSEVAKINLEDNKLSIITKLNYVTNVINMDGTILIPFRNKYYVAKGQSILNKDQLEVKKE